MRRERIGVHVEQRPLARRADGRDDGDVAERDQIAQQGRRRRGIERADEPEIDVRSVCRLKRRGDVGGGDAGVGARQPDRSDARRIQRRDERRVDPPREHAHDRGERVGVGNAQAVSKTRADAARAQIRVDRAAAAVHDRDRARRGETRDRCRRGRHRAGVFEQLAAELEHRQHQFSPSRSSNPNATLKFCTACPAAPLTRLSMHTTSTS